MKKLILTIFILFNFCVVLNAEENDIGLLKNTKSGILIEASTGKILYEKNSEEKLAPASMTKIMTLLLAYEEIEKGNLNYKDMVSISKNATSMGGSQIFLQENTEISVINILKAIGIASANDASVALAEKIGGTEENFVKMMNKKAKDLGLKNTNFKNPHGLDEANHYTTAKDLSVLARELIKHRDILKITSTYEEYLKKPDGSNFWLVNTNKLIRNYKGMDGLKTGYTGEAGYCLTATSFKEDMRLISVIMKSNSIETRKEDTTNLLDYGYNLYESKIIKTNNKKIANIYVDKSSKMNYPVYLKENIKQIFKKGEQKNKYYKKILLDKIYAPVTRNSVVGKIQIKENNKIYFYDLIVKEDIEKASIFKLFFNNFKNIISGNVGLK